MNVVRIETLIIFGFLLFSNCRCNIFSEKEETQNIDQETIAFDLSTRKKTIKNIFSDVNVWYYGTYWGDAASGRSSNYFKKYYPHVKRVQFMTATGGNESRDLFVNPEDRSLLNDYKFDSIIEALHNVVRQGLIPMIKTGAVPLKYSTNPEIGGFGVNVKPPVDFDVYYEYIKALAENVVNEFGIEEVRNWSWGVLTEYENKDWWSVDNNPQLSKEAYFKLYDYTVAALEDAIGAGNLIVGGHGMVCHPGLWDELEFIDHVAKGINYKTGKTGTQIDFIAASFYDETPGNPVDANLSLRNTIESLRKRAESNGLTNLKYGVDEGRILNGPDGLPLISRIMAHSFQGAADARLFKTMNDLDADWFSTWGLNTNAFWEGIPSVGTHIAWLSYKMVGEQELTQTSGYQSNHTSNEVDGLASYDSNENKLHVLVYNYNSSLEAETKENPQIRIENVQSLVNNEVLIKQWIVDGFNGNYWPAWFSDMKSNGLLSKRTTGWSSYSVEAPQWLKVKERLVWYENTDKYRELALLKSVTFKKIIEDGRIVLPTELEHHGVVFFEIENVLPVQKDNSF